MEEVPSNDFGKPLSQMPETGETDEVTHEPRLFPVRIIIFFSIISVVIYLLFAGGYYFFNEYRTQREFAEFAESSRKIAEGVQKMESLKSSCNCSTIGDDIVTNEPALPDGYDWKEISFDEAQILTDPRMFAWEDKSCGGELRDIFLSQGKLYMVELNFATLEEMRGKGVNSFLGNYTSQLLDYGWQYEITYDDYSISGEAADGVTGSRNGFVRNNNNIFQTLVLGEETDGDWRSSDEGPITLSCPCTLRFEIFISDPISICEVVSK